MEDNLGHIVYSKNVLEFVTVAGEYCNFIETVNETERKKFLMKAQKLLPLLYLKGSLLPILENEYDEFTEKFVTEDTWNYYEKGIKTKLGKYNDYLEVFDPDIGMTEGPVSARLSENLSDIYQDVKDFLSAYRIGTVEIMNDALWECQENFEQYWGQKLLNALRAIHLILYDKEGIQNEDEDWVEQNEENNLEEQNTEGWIITKRQQQYRKDEDEE